VVAGSGCFASSIFARLILSWRERRETESLPDGESSNPAAVEVVVRREWPVWNLSGSGCFAC
jgi:hypothetical protein